jgi:hypothetical protein
MLITIHPFFFASSGCDALLRGHELRALGIRRRLYELDDGVFCRTIVPRGKPVGLSEYPVARHETRDGKNSRRVR